MSASGSHRLIVGCPTRHVAGTWPRAVGLGRDTVPEPAAPPGHGGGGLYRRRHCPLRRLQYHLHLTSSAVPAVSLSVNLRVRGYRAGRRAAGARTAPTWAGFAAADWLPLATPWCKSAVLLGYPGCLQPYSQVASPSSSGSASRGGVAPSASNQGSNAPGLPRFSPSTERRYSDNPPARAASAAEQLAAPELVPLKTCRTHAVQPVHGFEFSGGPPSLVDFQPPVDRPLPVRELRFCGRSGGMGAAAGCGMRLRLTKAVSKPVPDAVHANHR